MAKKLANELGGLRLAILSIEYAIHTNVDQLAQVAEDIAQEFGADKAGVMDELTSTLRQLKRKEEALRKQNEPNQMKHTLKRMVKEGLMAEENGGYKLTVMGEVYAKHRITNDPESRALYEKLLRAHGVDPATDDLIGDEQS